jgi:hypothetical protein
MRFFESLKLKARGWKQALSQAGLKGGSTVFLFVHKKMPQKLKKSFVGGCKKHKFMCLA